MNNNQLISTGHNFDQTWPRTLDTVTISVYGGVTYLWLGIMSGSPPTATVQIVLCRVILLPVDLWWNHLFLHRIHNAIEHMHCSLDSNFARLKMTFFLGTKYNLSNCVNTLVGSFFVMVCVPFEGCKDFVYLASHIVYQSVHLQLLIFFIKFGSWLPPCPYLSFCIGFTVQGLL